MELLTSKWMIGLYVIIGIAVLLLLIGRKSVHSEVLINASPDRVWAVLTNGAEYDSWNSVIHSLEGELIEGNKVKFMFNQEEDKSYQITATVKEILPNELLNQKGGMPGIMTFNHRYIIEQTDGGTRMTIHEDYRGLMVPFWNPQPVQLAYERLNEDIKRQVEFLNQ